MRFNKRINQYIPIEFKNYKRKCNIFNKKYRLLRKRDYKIFKFHNRMINQQRIREFKQEQNQKIYTEIDH